MRKLKWAWCGILCGLWLPVMAAPVTYTLDPLHTTVTWQLNHLGFSTFSGKYFATGSMIYDESKPELSSVTATIKIADGITGIPELDKHIAGNAFLDGRKFPTATFVSKTVEMTGAHTALVTGVLTLHGVSQNVHLNVVFNRVGLDKITKKQTAGFSATTTISRSDYGVTIFIPDLSDEVKMDIEAEAYLPKTSK